MGAQYISSQDAYSALKREYDLLLENISQPKDDVKRNIHMIKDNIMDMPMRYETKENKTTNIKRQHELPRNISTDWIVKATTMRQVKQEKNRNKLSTEPINSRSTSVRTKPKERLNTWVSEISHENIDGTEDNYEEDLLRYMEAKVSIKGKHTKSCLDELTKRCPYIYKLKQTSDKYNRALIMIETLARYNNLIRKLIKSNIIIENKKELEKYNEFIKRDRSLRIELKYLLNEQDENQKNIDRMKESMNIFGIQIGRASCRERVSSPV